MSVIYQVQLEIDDSHLAEFDSWLNEHVAEVVKAAGFTSGIVYEDDQIHNRRVVHYHSPDLELLRRYLNDLAPRFRQDGINRFGGHFRSERAVLTPRHTVRDLTGSDPRTQIEHSSNGRNHRKDVLMNTQASWRRIKNELHKLTDVNQLKSEVQRIGNELRNFDFHTVLSPTAQAKVKMFERRYADLMRTMQQAQRQMDRELNKILRQIKNRRVDVTKVVKEQKSKLNDLRKRFTANSSKLKKAAAKRATSKKARRTTKARATKKRSR